MSSWIADSIDTEYRREQYFKKKMKRQACKEKECKDCYLNSICEDTDYKEEGYGDS